MKTKVFNPLALRMHAGMKTALIRQLDRTVASARVNLKKTSVIVHDFGTGDGVIRFEESSVEDMYKGVGNQQTLAVTYLLNGHLSMQIVFMVPMAIVLKGAQAPGHCVYQIGLSSVQERRSILDNGPAETNGENFFYIGKTSRGVAQRLNEHVYSSSRGSNTRFHRIMRGGSECGLRYPPSGITVMGVAPSSDEAYDLEEELIASGVSAEAKILNVMGSRDAAAQFKDRFGGEVDPEIAEEEILRRSTRAQQNWTDPDYAESVICHNPRNFDADDVRLIRYLLRTGEPARSIAKNLGVSVHRVKALETGRRYGRIL